MKTKKVRFKATEHHKSHYVVSHNIYFFDGDIVEVDEALANRLLEQYPENFEDVESLTKKMKEAKGGKKKVVEDGETKAKEAK